MRDVGRMLVIAGCIMALLGAVLWSGIGKDWLGKLPGDIHYSKGKFSIHFPIMTCLLVSIVLTVILWLVRR